MVCGKVMFSLFLSKRGISPVQVLSGRVLSRSCLPPPSRIGGGAGGMPLAFVQKDFLVFEYYKSSSLFAYH